MTAIMLTTIAFLTTGQLTLKHETRWEPIPLAGFVEAEWESNLTTNRMAQVIETPVKQGARVQAGTLLIRLEDQALKADQNAIQQAIGTQKLALHQSELQLARMRRLEGQGAVSKRQLEQTQLERRAQSARLDELQAKLSALREQHGYLEIRAPADGQLVELRVTQGDTAMPGQSLGRLVTATARILRVPLPAHLLSQAENAKWAVRSSQSTTWWDCEIQAIADSPDASTSTYQAYLQAPAAIRAFEQVEVAMLLPSQGLFVPQEAVDQRGNLSYVFLAGEAGNTRRLVKLGPPLHDGIRPVLGGLKAGESILLGGGQ